MKLLLLLGFLFVGLNATAQRQVVRQSVDDDGRHLVVEFDLERRGERQAIRRTFDVQGLTKVQKQALLRQLVDSLGLPREAADVALLDEEVPAAEPLALAESEEPEAPESVPTEAAAPTRAVPCAKSRVLKARATVVP